MPEPTPEPPKSAAKRTIAGTARPSLDLQAREIYEAAKAERQRKLDGEENLTRLQERTREVLSPFERNIDQILNDPEYQPEGLKVSKKNGFLFRDRNDSRYVNSWRVKSGKWSSWSFGIQYRYGEPAKKIESFEVKPNWVEGNEHFKANFTNGQIVTIEYKKGSYFFEKIEGLEDFYKFSKLPHGSHPTFRFDLIGGKFELDAEAHSTTYTFNPEANKFQSPKKHNTLNADTYVLLLKTVLGQVPTEEVKTYNPAK